MIVTGISDLLGESGIPIVDIAASYEELSELAMDKLQPGFDAIGLELTLLLIENISLPDEVEKAIDRRSQMGAVGNLDAYMKFQTAEAIREAASNPNAGGAGTGAGFGAGMAMAQMMGQTMNRPADNAGAASGGAAAPGTASAHAPGTSGGGGAVRRTDGNGANEGSTPADGGGAGAGANEAGANMGSVSCSCGFELQPGQKFCPECGSPRPQKRFCSQCGETLGGNARFCSGCGAKA
jgi:membrane protease subunit (stomatin/prohibitin family)